MSIVIGVDFERTLIENKHVVIGSDEYRLTIKQEYRKTINRVAYVTYLSDINSQYTTNGVFLSISSLESNLKTWLVKANGYNNPEGRVLEGIRQWDGVIHT